MAVQVYKSTDGDAPILTGESGKLIEVLEACLVTGYTGRPGAGWSVEKEPASAIKAFFYPTDPAAFGCGIYFDDEITDGGGARYASGVGLEPGAWGGFDAGAPVIAGNRFPSEAQVAWGSWWYKSVSIDSASRPWIIIADERFFYFISDPRNLWKDGGTNNSGGAVHAFGDLVPFGLTDVWACLIAGETETADTTFLHGAQGQSGADGFALFNISDADQNSYVARAANGTLPPIPGRGDVLAQTWPGTGGVTYPLKGTASDALVHPIYWYESGDYRAALPGAYSVFHHRPFGHGEETALRDGRILLHVELPAFRWDDPPCLVSFDVTGPWR